MLGQEQFLVFTPCIIGEVVTPSQGKSLQRMIITTTKCHQDRAANVSASDQMFSTL